MSKRIIGQFRTGRRVCESKCSRKGVFSVLALFCLPVLLGFAAIAVDTGLIGLTKTNMQNAVDAAALAASQEISGAIRLAGEEGEDGDPSIDANSIAVAQARQMAYDVALANDVLIDPDAGVEFGKRVFNAANGTWPIRWGEAPYNCVKVTAGRDQSKANVSSVTVPAGDGRPERVVGNGKLGLWFGWALGNPDMALTTSATAFVEARDIVAVLDFSGSMNDDSSMKSFSKLGQSNVEQALDGMWQALREADPKWPGTSESKFPAAGFGKMTTASGKYISSSNTNRIFRNLRLNRKNSDGTPKYPFPQAGKNSDGTPKSRPSYSTSESRWEDYIDYVKGLSGTYNKRYGFRTLMDYLQEKRYGNSSSEDLWRTPHYPFHAVKEGATLFLDFLTNLDFGDEVGLVSYASTARQETTLEESDASVDISGDPITTDYSLIDTMQRHKQAGHYSNMTNMGDGIKKAKELMSSHIRYGARPTMLLMTDGNTNQRPSGFSLPGDWDWDALTDYDGDGHANYTTSNRNKQYAFWEARQAIDLGVTIHTMSVGAGSDWRLMKAIAFAGGGVWINVPGNTTIAAMKEEIMQAFTQIAAKVPPAKLVYGDETPGGGS